jgi:predicted P-loop ATPase/GTPase
MINTPLHQVLILHRHQTVNQVTHSLHLVNQINNQLHPQAGHSPLMHLKISSTNNSQLRPIHPHQTSSQTQLKIHNQILVNQVKLNNSLQIRLRQIHNKIHPLINNKHRRVHNPTSRLQIQALQIPNQTNHRVSQLHQVQQRAIARQTPYQMLQSVNRNPLY